MAKSNKFSNGIGSLFNRRAKGNNSKQYDVMNPEEINPNIKKSTKNITKELGKLLVNVAKQIGKFIVKLIKLGRSFINSSCTVINCLNS